MAFENYHIFTSKKPRISGALTKSNIKKITSQSLFSRDLQKF